MIVLLIKPSFAALSSPSSLLKLPIIFYSSSDQLINDTMLTNRDVQCNDHHNYQDLQLKILIATFSSLNCNISFASLVLFSGK